MKLGLNIAYSGLGITAADQLRMVKEAEAVGFDSVWAAEAYGSDAATVLAWLAAQTERIRIGSAIFQMPARSPAMTPMTAATPDGPGKALKLMISPVQERIPIFIAAIGPKNTAQTAEIADGWIPFLFAAEHVGELRKPLDEGAARAGRSLDDGSFEIAPTVNVCIDDDIEAARDVMRPFLALYVGGMGSREKNFYNALMRRYGYEEAAEKVQDLYLSGKKQEAAEALPAEFIDSVCLVGPA